MVLLPDERRIFAALLAALLILAVIGITWAKAIWSAAAVHQPNRNSNYSFDGDYVQGLSKHGVVKLPGYEAVLINPTATK